MPSLLFNLQPFLSQIERRAFARVAAEGEALGEYRGKVEAKTEAILKILTKRGVSITEAHRERILECSDLAELDRWFDRALTAVAIDELFA